MSRKGKAVLSGGDWSMSSAEVRSGAIYIHDRPQLMVRFKIDLIEEMPKPEMPTKSIKKPKLNLQPKSKPKTIVKSKMPISEIEIENSLKAAYQDLKLTGKFSDVQIYDLQQKIRCGYGYAEKIFTRNEPKRQGRAERRGLVDVISRSPIRSDLHT